MLVLLFFNGCAQNTALLGPIYTIGTTGNTLQAGVSYGTSYAIKKVRTKNISRKTNVLSEKNELKEDLKENPDDFFRIIKRDIKRLNREDIFANQ